MLAAPGRTRGYVGVTCPTIRARGAKVVPTTDHDLPPAIAALAAGHVPPAVLGGLKRALESPPAPPIQKKPAAAPVQKKPANMSIAELLPEEVQRTQAENSVSSFTACDSVLLRFGDSAILRFGDSATLRFGDSATL